MDINELARLGAQARLNQLEQERAALLREFPGLRGNGGIKPRGGRRRGAGPRGGLGAGGTKTARRRRPKMSAAQKKAVSLRMKKYWAERRKTKQKPAAAKG